MRRSPLLSILFVIALASLTVGLQAKGKSANNAVAGTWTCVAHGGENGDIHFTLYLQQTAEGLTGTVSAPQGDTDLTSVTFKDNKLKIDIDTSAHSYSLAATLAKGKLTGEWHRDGQKEGTWEGKK